MKYSQCCDALPQWGAIDDLDGEYHGVCSECKEHTQFYDEDEDFQEWVDAMEQE